MAKFEIKIVDASDKETVAYAIVNNGNWQYMDDYMETDKLESVTINTINKAHYITQPVKDYIQDYDWDKYEESGELIETNKIWRSYTTLLEYLNCRMGNLTEYRVKRDRTRKFECILMEFGGRYSEITEESDFNFKNGKKLEVTISMRV